MPTVSPDDYFRAGRDLLAEGGIQAVTIAGLCERLHVTKGSFYSHFTGVDDFLDRLLEDWLAEHVARRTAAIDAQGDPTERLKLLKTFMLDREHGTEAAIRAWARTEPRAAAVQRQIDQNRITYAVQSYVELGIPPDDALTFAELAVVLVAGTQNLMGPVDIKMLARLSDVLIPLVRGALPPTRRNKPRSTRRDEAPAG